MLNKFPRNFLLLIVLFASGVAFANPTLLPFQGRVTDASGNTVNYAVTINFRILPPSGTCYIYEDTQVVTPNDFGVFSVLLGDPANRTGPANNFSNIFNNAPIVAITNSCATTYSPSANDWRRIQVIVDGYTLPDVQTIASAPFAMHAAFLGGKALTDLIQINGNVTQANLATLTGAGDASSLHNHDSLYARTDGSNSFSGAVSSNVGFYAPTAAGAIGVGTSTPSTDIHVRKTSPGFRLEMTSGGGGNSSLQFYSGTTERARIQVSEASNAMTFSTGGANALTIDASQNATFSGNILSGGFLQTGRYTTAQENTLNTTYLSVCGVSCLGTVWGNSTTGEVRYWDGTGIRVVPKMSPLAYVANGIVTSTASSMAVLSPGSNGQVLSMVAGAPAWTNNGSSLTNVSASALRGVNINTTAPTSGQVLKYNGTDWIPAADNDSTPGDASYAAKGLVQFLTNEATSGLNVSAGVVRLGNVGTAGTYGSGSQIPVFTTDAFGRVTSVTNTAIGINASSVTAGTLPVTRGGTGATSYTANRLVSTGATGTAFSDFTCASGQVVKFDVSGNAVCGTDNDSTPAAATYSSLGLVQVDTNLATSGLNLASGVLSMPAVGTAGTYGSATQIPVITTDAKGRVTGVTNTAIDTSVFQSRVTGTCAAGSSIRTIAADGTVTCETDDNTVDGDASYVAKGNVQIDTNLATSGLSIASGVLSMPAVGTAGTYGSATQVPVITTDAKGRVSGVVNTTISGVAPGGSAGGDLGGTYPNPTVNRIRGTNVNIAALADDHILQFNGTDFVNRLIPTCAATEYLTFNGTAYSCVTDVGSGGTVASISVTAPIQNTGTAANPIIALADTAVTTGSYGSASSVATFTVDQKGRLTTAGSTAIALNASAITAGTLPVARGGTNSSTALNNNRIMVSSGGSIVEAGALTNGQLLIGSTGAAPVAAALTAGGGVTVTNGAGSITFGADTSVLQARVSSTCAAGSSIRAIAADGTVTCETDDNSVDGDASYVAKGNVQIDTDAATSGLSIASGVLSLPAVGTAGTYGAAATVPVITTDAKGRVSSVTNTAIALNASAITAGTLATDRGGTGLSFANTTIADGQLLIGNNAGDTFTKAALTAAGGVTITNGAGSITIGHDNTVIQNRVSSTCAAGSSIRAIAADGTVTCETDDNSGTPADASYVAKGIVQIDTDAATSGLSIASGVLRMPAVGTAGTYGAAATVPVITTDAFGRVSGVTNTAIALNASAITAGTLPIARGGTGATSFGNNTVFTSNSSGALANIGLTNGQILIGSTVGAPAAGTLTAGGGVTVTNGSNSITLGADTSVLQSRVTSTCAAGSSIRAIAADGTVTCETDDNSGTPADASYAAKGIVQFDTNEATSGIEIASGVAKLGDVGTAGTYGAAATVPVITTDIFGRVTSVTNTSIALNASAITAGTLPTDRGGTGLSFANTTISDGQLLIGNNAGDTFTKAALTAAGGITVTNGAGSITIGHDNTVIQNRVSSTCAAGSSIRAIAADGTVTCETDDNNATPGDASYIAKGIVQIDTDAATSGLSIASGVLSMPAVGTAGTYGAAATVPVLTTDAKGRVSGVTNTAIAINASAVTAGTLPIARGGTNSSTALNNNRIMVSSGGSIVEAGALTNGQLLIGSTGAAPVAAALTAGGGVTVTNGAGSITFGADTSVLQARVTSTCAAGSSIRAIAADGTVTCETDDNSGTPADASYAAKGVVQFDTNEATSGIEIASGVAKLGDVGTAGTYGAAATVPVITTDVFGRVTSVTNTAIALNASAITAGTLPVARGGTGVTTFGNNTVFTSNSSGALTNIGLTNGQILIGSTVGAPAAGTITAGGGVTVTNGSNSITLGADTSVLQSRVTSTCAAGSSIRAIAADGTVTCETDDNSGTPSDASYAAKGILQVDTDAATSGLSIASGVLSMPAVGTAGTYGSATQVPVITTDAKGRVSGVTNTAIALNASAITAGTLPTDRGGTGLSFAGTAITDGQLLIGNNAGDGFTRAALSQSGGITVTNGAGSITIGHDNTVIQNRVSSTCAAGSSIRAIAADGTVTCETDDNSGTPSDASYAAKGIVQFDTNEATSGIEIASGVAKLGDVGTAGTYGAAATVPVITTDIFGRVTSVTNTAIAINASAVTAGTLPIARGGTNSATALNNNRIMVSSGGSIVEAGALTNGQLLIGSTGAAPVAAALTAGGGVTVTNGAGSITFGADTSVLQARVTSTCAAGSSIRAIAADGTVTCETDDNNATPGDASYAAKGIVQIDTDAATSGLSIASGVLSMPAVGTAGTYGAAATVPVITTDAKGRVSSVTNTAIALNASAITAGTLPIARGGTGATAFGNNTVFTSDSSGALANIGLTNGQIIIGSTVGAPAAGTITAGGGVTVTNGSNSITLGADTSVLQSRVSSTCAAGSSIRAIAADGTVTCETDDNSATPGDASYAAKGIVQIDTDAATSGLSIASGVLRLPAVGTAGTYGAAATVPVITTDAFGRVSGVTNTAIALNASAVTAGTLPTDRGGTGLSFAGTAIADGELLIGNNAGDAFVKAALTGTANQVTVTNGAGSITLSTPQNIHTAATPTFSSLTLSSTSGLTVGTNALVVSSGNVGIGLAGAPAEKLDVNGNVQATAFLYTSDRRLKTNFRQSPGLDAILQLDGVSFDWKANGKHEIGLIAQDVEKVLPDLVNTNPKTGMKSVKYGNLVAPLIESTKEIYGMCKASEEQLQAQARKMASLEDRLNRLEKENEELKKAVRELLGRSAGK